MTTLHPKTGIELLVVEVPSIAFGIMVNNYGDESELMFMLSTDDMDLPSDIDWNDETLITKKLIGTSWKFIATTKDIAEEQAAELVENKYDPVVDKDYYKMYDTGIFSTGVARNSLFSLLRSQGLDPQYKELCNT